ncbi:PS-10 peptidase S37 [Natronoflexus pectinivorans]|uniref:PS-10 peptidase S37 n=1 Tax=Natronoflexus pectinivorans TaxID=682526 RepID=A0A4R2GFD7_9BACT|nr:PS-10 peptidase S37 [Natronoflexus pectinivorans]
MRIRYHHIWKSLFLLIAVSCSVRYQTLNELYDKERDLVYEQIETFTGFNQSFLVWVEQPVDHHNPESGTFKQRAWVNHVSNAAPVVIVTEGYMAPQNYASELSQLLGANQIVVEHRFFGESRPDSIDWQYLTIDQAARDHQNVIQIFRKLYRGKWVSTGISKGGQAAIIHRAMFPRSVDATVTYVAPFNLERDDKRLIDFFNQIGTHEERGRILAFQKEVLKRRNQMIPMFEEMAEEKGWTFSMGIEKAFELSVLEYPFSLWQWCVPLDLVPSPSVSSRELFDHLYRGIDFSYFTEQESEQVGPFFIQAYSELGYYGYLTTPLQPYLKTIDTDTISSDILIPDVGFQPVYHPQPINNVKNQLHRSDPRMLLITGGNDPWSATTPDISQLKNSIHIEMENGCHLTRIESLPDSLRKDVIETFRKWNLLN